MSSSDESSGPSAKACRTVVRRKKLSEVVPKKSIESDSIYTSIGKKSMQYSANQSALVTYILPNKTIKADTKKLPHDAHISSEVQKIKEELGEIGVDVRTLDEEERKLWVDRMQRAAATLEKDNGLLPSPTDNDLVESITISCSDDSSSRLDRLCDSVKEDQPPSYFKVFISFGKETRPINVDGKETLQDVLSRINLNFTRQPRVYEPGSSMFEANLIPVKFHKKTLQKLGFSNLSILNCVCLQDDENEEPAPGMKKLIFRVGNVKNVPIFASPTQKFSELIEEFEKTYPFESIMDKLNAKYHFDGELVKPEDTIASLEMENGDFVDVFLT